MISSKYLKQITFIILGRVNSTQDYFFKNKYLKIAKIFHTLKNHNILCILPMYKILYTVEKNHKSILSDFLAKSGQSSTQRKNQRHNRIACNFDTI